MTILLLLSVAYVSLSLSAVATGMFLLYCCKKSVTLFSVTQNDLKILCRMLVTLFNQINKKLLNDSFIIIYKQRVKVQ